MAYGISNVFTCFFNGFTASQAPPRTLVHEATGGKSQVASLVSAVLVLMIVLFIGPYIEVNSMFKSVD